MLDTTSEFAQDSMLQRRDTLYRLECLNDKLKELSETAEMVIYGGAVMCLCLEAREMTHDIDAVFKPKMQIYEIAECIAKENDFEKNWLNDAVKGFVSSAETLELVKEFSNLTVNRATDEYMLAMKVMSCRLENDTEREDIKFLIQHIGLQTLEDVVSVVLRYYPEKLVLPKSMYAVEEILNEI